jgi:YVTN family beta-propeller protein
LALTAPDRILLPTAYSVWRVNRAFVANTASDTVNMLDTQTGSVERTIPVGQEPSALAVDKTTGSRRWCDAERRRGPARHAAYLPLTVSLRLLMGSLVSP